MSQSPDTTSAEAATSPLLLDRLESLREAEADWISLAPRTRNVFASWEWASTWWQHFGRTRRPLVTICRASNGGPLAVLPLYLWRSAPLRVARFIGHGPADQLGPLCGPEERPVAAAGVKSTLESARCQVLVGDTLDSRERWSELLDSRVYGRGPNPILSLEWPSWDDFLASCSGNFRSQLRRRERALGNLGLRYRLCEQPGELERDLDTFFALHRRRWHDGRSNVARLEAFHRDFALLAFARGWLRLWFLEVRGTPVAAWYGLRFGDVDWYYQAGRDPAWDRYGVGFVLLAHSIREAIEDGKVEYRFGRGGQHYKTRFGPADDGLETIVLARDARARAALAAVAAARKVKRALPSRVRAPFCSERL